VIKEKKWLAVEGYDPIYGARPLKRVIQKAILQTLSKLMIGGKVLEGDTVIIDVKNGELILQVYKK